MNKKEDSFEKAMESLRNDPVPPGPSPELVDATMAQLADNAGLTSAEQFNDGMSVRKRLKTLKSFGRVAATVAVLLTGGYAVGRWSAPKPLDMEQIQATIEPAIRQNLLDEAKEYVQSSLANGFLQVKDELSEQCRQEMSRVAMQTLAASNTLTNELLTKLLDAFHAAQIQDRRLVAAALEQIELNRLRDRNQLSNAFAALAVQTEEELMRTQKNVAEALFYALPDNVAPYESENLDHSNERNQK